MYKKYKAKEDFIGVITMQKGQIKAMDPNSIHVKDLLKAKLLEEVKAPKKSKKE